MKSLNAEGDAEARLAELRRRSMVSPAKPGFTPAAARRKIALTLKLEAGRVRAGGYPRIRFELTNLGSEALDYSEYRPSYFSEGATPIDSPTLSFRLTDPRGRTAEILPYSGHAGTRHSTAPPRPPQGMNAAEMERWARETNALSAAYSTFRVKLQAGETLQSQGDGGAPQDSYKTLYTDSHLSAPGRYKLQVILDDRPKPLTELLINALIRGGMTRAQIVKEHDDRLRTALGPVASNVVTFEVAR